MLINQEWGAMICKDCIVEMESADLIHFEEGRVLNVQICPACGTACAEELMTV